MGIKTNTSCKVV